MINIFKRKFFLSVIILVFAFYINFYYSNIGLYPIDTFSFFDAGYNVTQGYHPIKDYWVISGILVDYIQAIFFYIFGPNWNSYVFHASFLNSVISFFFFFFLNQFNKSLITNFFLSISVAILCYPVIGTPFPYQHSLIISLISALVFYLGVEKEDKIYWILLPVLMTLSFLSMQLPSGLINFFIILYLIIYFINFDSSNLKYFIFGVSLTLIFFFLYILATKVNINDFFEQLIFFPLSIGEGRILNAENAFEGAKLANKFTFRGILGHFKFINIFVFFNILFMFLHIKNNQKKFKLDKIILLNSFILLCSISFIFHQLITANQTFIFSLIPILCGLSIILIKKTKPKINTKFFNILFVLILIFSTVKYHLLYNEKRKFIDLQNLDLTKGVSADVLDDKFSKLKWITPTNLIISPSEELNLLLNSINIIKKDKSEKMLITHYQFFSILLDENLNIPNRWYFPNNTFPATPDNKYYRSYLKRIHAKINDNKIEKIYIVETFPDEFLFLNLKDFTDNRCFSKKKLNKILLSIIFEKCPI